MSRNDLPSEKASNFGARLRETVQTMLGLRGDKLDRVLTLRDLIESGITKLAPGWRPGGTGAVPLLPGSEVAAPYEPDLTPPPIPDGFTVSAAISHIFIEHAAPLYPQGHGHLRTRVYGATVEAADPLPTFGDAVEITQFSGTVFAHATNPATAWRLWIKWETNDGVLSASPAGGANGLEAVTGRDVSKLLDAVQGVITDGHLYRSLTDDEAMSDAVGRLRGVISTHKAAQETLGASATVAEAVNAQADTLNGALAQKVAVLEARFGGSLAVLQQNFETTADALGYVSTRYTLKTALTHNGTTVVGGFGLVGMSNEGAPPTIDFGVIANKFFIAAPAMNDLPARVPFIVQTTETTINGVTVPVGIYMSDAFIQNGTITNAKIANLAVDNAKIANLSADKLTAGSIAVGQHIQSTGYIAGSAGWRINGDGTAELSGVVVRGTVYASAGQIGGITIASNAVRAGQSAFDTGNGFYLGADGKFSLGNGTQRLTWDGSGLTIKGSLDGATGTFYGLYLGNLNASQITAGYLSASRIDTDTINAGMIISRSATSFEQASIWAANDEWEEYSFYMDHDGIATVMSSTTWNQSGSGGSYSVQLTINSLAAPAGISGSWYSSVAPTPPVLMYSSYLTMGFHSVRVKSQISTATNNHVVYFTLLKSYR